jgi:diacylglycerol kinase (ATP)
MRVLLTYNPTAGDDGVDADGLVAALEAAGHEVVARSVKGEHWARRLSDDFELVVAAGGDGTAGRVFKRLAGGSTPVALLPEGSANNIATTLGLDVLSPAELIDVLADARRVPFDVSSLAWDGNDRKMIESAGGGIFADLLVQADETDANAGGDDKVALGLRVLRDAAGEAESGHWYIEADGKDLSAELIGVEIANIPLLGPNVPIAPSADPSDGVLDIVLLREENRADLAAYAEARLAKRQPPELELDAHQARRIVLRPPPASACHVDDKLVSGWDGTVTVSVESRLELLIPVES